MRKTSKFSFVAASIAAFAMALSGLAAADAPTAVSITIDDAYDNGTTRYVASTAASIEVDANHCPPGGDMRALTVEFSNTSNAGPWTQVKADGDNWGTAADSGCTTVDPKVPTRTATFAWTLASGDAAKTVYARVRHSNDIAPIASDTVVLDMTAPVITNQGVFSGTAGANSWYTSAVVNRFTAADGSGSGLADSSKADFTVSSGTAEGSSVSIPSGNVADNVGNTNNSINAGPFKIDLGNPSVAITSHSDGDSVSTASITVAGTATDAVSGIAGVTVNGLAATLGTGTFQRSIDLNCGANNISATATDNAGRQATTSTISVTRTCSSPVAYTASFKQPLDANGVINKAKLGRVIPVKVEVFADGVEEKESTAISLNSQYKECSASSTTDTVESYTSGPNSGLSFRWDATGDFYMYNLDTSQLANAAANKCYEIAVLRDGTPIPGAKVVIQLTK